ncbi:MAG: sulfite exporter TauE/SafE family protein [Pseudomonadota bacterium]
MSLAIPFLIGLFSAFHCIGMCGGIMTALTLGLPEATRRSRAALLLAVTLYNSGRIISYALAGAIAGGLMNGAVDYAGPQQGLALLQRIAALILILIGLHLAGWLPQLSRIERLGVPLWRRIEPLTHRLMPFDAPWKLFLYGMLWGWLPCGMVYTMLTSSAVQGSSLGAGLYMAAFGVGTLLPVASAGFVAGSLRKWLGTPRVRMFFGVLVIAWGVLALLRPDFAARFHITGQSAHTPVMSCQ